VDVQTLEHALSGVMEEDLGVFGTQKAMHVLEKGSQCIMMYFYEDHGLARLTCTKKWFPPSQSIHMALHVSCKISTQVTNTRKIYDMITHRLLVIFGGQSPVEMMYKNLPGRYELKSQFWRD
jgi:hypothetical protein